MKKEKKEPIKSIFQHSWPSKDQMETLMGVKMKGGLSVFGKKTIIDSNDVKSLSVTDQKEVATKMWGKCSPAARSYLLNCDFIAVVQAAKESAKREARKINEKAAKLRSTKREKAAAL